METGPSPTARLRRTAAFAAAILTLAGTPTVGAEPEIDPATTLIRADGWELVAAHCGGCHSHRLVTAQRGDEEFWRTTIRWMQRTQNLWVIPEAQEKVLIAYLARNYNETDWGRRPPLNASLMPPP
jgi:hypothetical protein